MALKWSPILISTALAFVAQTAVFDQAFAQTKAEGHVKKHGFKSHDTDGDGVISKEEYLTRHNRHFAKVDKNGDGQISAEEREEVKAKRAERRAKHVERMKQRRAERHAQLDANNDGIIDAAEHEAMGEKIFARLDKNGDGQISEDEMPKRHMRRHHGKRPY